MSLPWLVCRRPPIASKAAHRRQHACLGLSADARPSGKGAASAAGEPARTLNGFGGVAGVEVPRGLHQLGQRRPCIYVRGRHMCAGGGRFVVWRCALLSLAGFRCWPAGWALGPLCGRGAWWAAALCRRCGGKALGALNKGCKKGVALPPRGASMRPAFGCRFPLAGRDVNGGGMEREPQEKRNHG